MRTVVAAGILLAAGGLMTTAVGLANADEVQVEGSYATQAACQVDGPHVEITHNDGAYTHFDCRQGSDGLWYLYLTN
ncbi:MULTISPECIES: hypothetical protein [Mycobacterium]|uniref:Secreted protein n=1 Tax=Mycobacterium kiyosense TaxID=2871094 RepID=A0A9P3Q8F0_9MYCO|nr:MULTISPECIES: hypothetical protein [Mycobacterium]BDB40137.1 hypothetical protein IWGMT90018_05830 [Mycobacterium kiyosense]BDE11972.1 hypothetical protein MKCMC460_08320 [Mycobacterium sp. 20KCMC460]GLB85199.1 hypothetical protein SRL2020028_44550 [Mycobacterium kiyosense]GLB92506.1 hypothetical protein SRL2020130_53230 [Mycobacterium kiyosense]GLB98734.1 hypothetical protein SRL2020226_55100 [Mycobacterium kiyosense]